MTKKKTWHIIHMGTHEHHSIPSSLTHMYLCSARFTANITHQHDNDRTLQAIYCYPHYLMGLLVITWEPLEAMQRAACG